MTFVTPSELVAFLLLLPSALFSRQKAPSISLSLLLAFMANLAYANGIATDESIRWVSALVGLAGVVEFGVWEGDRAMNHGLMNTKQCQSCKRFKELDCFYENKRTTDESYAVPVLPEVEEAPITARSAR